MVPDRPYGQGFFEGSNGRTTLLYFTAALPMVGFVHGATDLNRGNRTGFEGYAEARFIERARSMGEFSRRWSLGLRWLA